MAKITLNLTRGATTPPLDQGPDAPYDQLWTQDLSAFAYTAEGLARLRRGTTPPGEGLTLDSAIGDVVFRYLEFADGGGRLGKASATATPQATLDWVAAGQALLRLDAAAGKARNVEVSAFEGTTLRIERAVDAWVHLADDLGRTIEIEGARRGGVTLGGGDDVVRIGIDTSVKDPRDSIFRIGTGDGADSVTIGPAAGVLAPKERLTSVFVDLGAGSDSIVAGGTNDSVLGGEGDDRAELGGGTNQFDGGAGIDTYVVHGLRADYRLKLIAPYTYRLTDLKPDVDGDDGTTVLIDVERIQFKDSLWRAPKEKPPVANADAAATTEDTPVAIDVLANDRDPEGAPLTIIAFNPGAHGSVALVDGKLVYTPDADWSGTDSFNYTVQDRAGLMAGATVTVTVAAVDDGYVFTDPDGAARIEELAADTPFENLLLHRADGTLAFADLDGGPDRAAHTTLSFEALGTGYLGAFEAKLTYTITTIFLPSGDGGGVPVPERVIKLVSPVDWTYLVEDYELDRLLGGEERVQTYRVTLLDDGHVSSWRDVVVTLVGKPDHWEPPVPLDDAATTDEDVPVDIGVLLNDSDPTGDYLTVIAFDQGAHGTVSQMVPGILTYVPEADWSGDDSFTYTVDDGYGNQRSATVRVTVLPVNDTPVFADPDAATVVTELAWDDPLAEAFLHQRGGTLGFADPDQSDIRGLSVAALGDGYRGSFVATIDPDAAPGAPGAVTWSFEVEDSALDDLAQGEILTQTWRLTLTDLAGATATRDVVVTLVGAKEMQAPPAAQDDTAETDEDVPVRIDVLANDSDPDGDTLSITAFGQGQHGSVALEEGKLVYAPAADWFGEDSFLYQIEDGFGGSALATVRVTVRPVNDPPIYTSAAPRVTVTELPNGDPQENAYLHQRSGALSFVDVDPGDSHSITVRALGDGYRGSFSALDSGSGTPEDPGRVGWVFQVGDSELDPLQAGQTVTQTYRITVKDAAGATDTQDVTVELKGAADPLGRLYFGATNGSQGPGLYSYDPALDRVSRVDSERPNGAITSDVFGDNMAVLGGKLYYTVARLGSVLFKSYDLTDGTVTSLAPILPIFNETAGYGASAYEIEASGFNVYYNRGGFIDASGAEYLASLSAYNVFGNVVLPIYYPSFDHVFWRGEMWFSTGARGNAPLQLWSYDPGSLSYTLHLTLPDPDPLDATAVDTMSDLTPVGDRLFFTYGDSAAPFDDPGFSKRLGAYNALTGGFEDYTLPLGTAWYQHYRDLHDVNGTLYYVHDVYRYIDPAPNAGGFIRSIDPVTGTYGGTSNIKNSAFMAYYFTDVIQGKLWGKTEIDTAKGYEPTIYDPATGQFTVLDIYPGTTGSNPSRFEYLDGKVYFAADSKSPFEDGPERELWSYDLATGALRQIDINPDATISGGGLIFIDGIPVRQPLKVLPVSSYPYDILAYDPVIA